MSEIESELLRCHLGAFGVERQESGEGFKGFGDGPDPEELPRLEARVLEAPAARRALLSRLLRRTRRRGAERGANPAMAAGEVLAALVQAELRGDQEREAVLAATPPYLTAVLSRARGGTLAAGARSFGVQAASLAAGLLLARGADPELAEQGNLLARGFMACEHFVRGLDELEASADPEPMGAHPYADLLLGEAGARIYPKELAEAAMTALQAEMREAHRIARQISPGEDIYEVVAGIGEDAPENEAELLEAYRAARAEVEAAVAGDFPEPQTKLELALAPAQLHGLLPLTAYLPPSEFDPAGTVLLSEALGPMKSAHARPRTLLAFAHDGVPGSHLLFSAAQGDRLRRILLSPYAAQGWALYAARYATERLGSEKVALIAALDGARRAGRAFADAALHAGLATREEVQRILSETLSLPDGMAEAEVQGVARQPAYAALPWWLAQDIADRVRAAVDAGSAVRDAHAEIIAQGALREEEASA